MSDMEWHPIVFSEEEQAFMDYMEEQTRTLAHAMAIPLQIVGKITESNHPVIVESDCCQIEDEPMEEKTIELTMRDTQFLKSAQAVYGKISHSGTTTLYGDITKIEIDRSTIERIIANYAYDLVKHALLITDYPDRFGIEAAMQEISDLIVLPDVSKPATKYCTVCGVVYVQDAPGWYEHHTLVQDYAFCSRTHLEQWMVEASK